MTQNYFTQKFRDTMRDVLHALLFQKEKKTDKEKEEQLHRKKLVGVPLARVF